MKAKAVELTAAAEAATRRRDEIEAQNKLLLERLEKMSQQLPTDGAQPEKPRKAFSPDKNDSAQLKGFLSEMRPAFE